MKGQSNCDTCVHYVYDDELGYSCCEINLDEDEMVKYMQNAFDDCHYYQLDDEYGIVRKQN